MVYQINPASDNEPEEPFFGYRLFWSQSYAGRFVPDYESGLALGADDITAGTMDNFAALRAVPSAQRDMAWNAKVDGYSYATRVRGPNELRR